MSGVAPVVPVRIELVVGAGPSPLSEPQFQRSLSEAVSSTTGFVMSAVGVPGVAEVNVTVTCSQDGGRATTRPLRMFVNDRRCRLPAEELQRTIGYLLGVPATPPAARAGTMDAQLAAAGITAGADQLIALACGQALCRRPGTLMGRAQAETFRNELLATMAPEHVPSVQDLQSLLASVLSLRVSIADRAAVSTALLDTGGQPLLEILERLVAGLRRPCLTLEAPRSYLFDLMGTEYDLAGDIRTLCETIAGELGLSLPPPSLLPNDSLRPGAIRITVNDLPELPWIGLAAGECLVHASAAEFAAHSLSRDRPALHPGYGTAATIMPAGAVAGLGLPTWNAAEFAALCLGAAVRTHAACFVDAPNVAAALDTIADIYPSTALAGRAALGLRLPPLLRRLLAEEMSVTDLTRVIELALTHASAETSLSDDTIAAIRRNMRRTILRRWGGGPDRDTITSFAVSEELEAVVDSDEEPSEQDADRILDALQDELDFLPTGAALPVLLTSDRVRSKLRRIVAREFPRIGVLAKSEIAPEATLWVAGDLHLLT